MLGGGMRALYSAHMLDEPVACSTFRFVCSQCVLQHSHSMVGVSQREQERSEQHHRQSSWTRLLHMFGACGSGHGRHEMAESAMRWVRAPGMVMIPHGDGGRWLTLAYVRHFHQVSGLYVRTSTGFSNSCYKQISEHRFCLLFDSYKASRGHDP